MSQSLFDVAIVGGGLAGLTCAVKLVEHGLNVRVQEAHPEAGGRVRSIRDHDVVDSADRVGGWLGDLGPSWVWPDYQPILKKWIGALDVEIFPQYDTGNAIVDLDPESTPVVRHVPSQHGLYRVRGGTSRLIEALLDRLPADSVQCGQPVSGLRVLDDKVELTLHDQTPELSASRVIIATPPRIAALLSWFPDLPSSLEEVLQQTPTWMASQAKIVLLYKEAFWRSQGLSGRMVSHAGPVVELHDHCDSAGFPAALMGFMGIPHQARLKTGDDLGPMIMEQLIRVFGNDSPKPVQMVLRDWAYDQFVTTDLDLTGLAAHPAVRPATLRQSHYGDKVWFAGAECSAVSPGLIEGAFSSAESVISQVLKSF